MRSSGAPTSALALYVLFTCAAVAGDRLLYDRDHPSPSAWALSKVALPGVLTIVAWLVARRHGSAAHVLGLDSAPRRHMLLAVIAGTPSLVVVASHAIVRGADPFLGVEAAKLVVRIAANQAWLEELLARGFLLGMLRKAGTNAQRAVWISAVAFALMHVEQFLVPPVSLAGIANGAVLALINLPFGVAAARLTIAARSLWPAVLLHLLVDLCILPQKLLPSASTIAILSAALTAAGIVIAATRLARAPEERSG